MVGRLDPALVDVVADRRLALRPPNPHQSIAELRRACNAFLATAMPGEPVADVQTLSFDGAAGAVRLRLYRPDRGGRPPVILFLHGGGFVFGGLDTHDATCRALCNAADAAVVAVDYRLAPEQPFPAALDDCRAALDGLTSRPEALGLDGRVGLAGDSAGGQLAVATALAAKADGVRLAHLGLFYPLVDPACDSPSARAFAEGFMLTRTYLRWCWDAYGATPGARAAPLFDLNLAELGGLPSATVVTAEFDPLRDEGEALVGRLTAAGVPVTHRRFAGMIHGFVGLPQAVSAAQDAVRYVAQGFRDAFERR